MPTIDTWTEMETFNFYQLAQVKHLETSFFNSFDLFESCTRPFDDEELEDTGERLLAIRRSQEWLVCSRVTASRNTMILLAKTRAPILVNVAPSLAE